MDGLLIFIFILIIISSLLILIDFFHFICTGRLYLKAKLVKWLEVVSLVALPLFFLDISDFGQVNDCCYTTAVFSPNHRLSIYILIVICLIAYFYSSYRKLPGSPVVEIITNALLLIGIILNVLICIQNKELVLAILGNVPIIILFVLMLVKNQRLLMEQIQQMEIKPKNSIEAVLLKILLLKPVVKIPILFVLCLPLLAIIAIILLVAGQKPDSLVRAFTDTYKQGFSQLDYMCNNVECGEHFLCSVAAKGHKQVVKPTRLGIRNQQLILCNRQLLISNAFEDLIQQRLPFLHKPIRSSYNRIGDLIHRHYTVFNNKWICDIVYVLMKPAEWLFLLTLYTFDKNPENRIAKQYISRAHRQQLEKQAN